MLIGVAGASLILGMSNEEIKK